MRYAIVFVLFFCFIVCSSFAVGNGTPTDTDAILKIMFNYANTGNLKALEAMKAEVIGQRNKTLALAYSLALYIASPNTYERQYVEAFPVNFEDIMYDLYERIELKRLTPAFLYSVESIGSIAKKGNEKAIEKVFRGYVHSDGAVSESFCDSMMGLFIEQAQKTVSVLSRIDKEDRQRDYLCLSKLSPEQLAQLKKNIEKLTPTVPTQERLVIREIMEIK
jgi:hypothetical protein